MTNSFGLKMDKGQTLGYGRKEVGMTGGKREVVHNARGYIQAVVLSCSFRYVDRSQCGGESVTFSWFRSFFLLFYIP